MKITMFVLLWVGAAAAAMAVAWQGVSLVDHRVIHPPSTASSVRSSTDFVAGPVMSADVVQASADSSGAALDGRQPGGEAVGATASPQPNPTFGASATPTTRVQAQAATPGEAVVAPTTPPNTQPTARPRATPTSRPRRTPTASPTSTVRPQSTPSVIATTTPKNSPGSPRATPTSKPTQTPKPQRTPTPFPTTTPVSTPASQPSQTLTFTLIGGTTAVRFSPAGIDVLWASPAPGFAAEIVVESPGYKVEFRNDDGGRSRIDAWWDAGPQWTIREDHD